MSRKRQKKIGSFDVGGISPTTTKLQLNNTNTATFNHDLLHSDKSTYNNAYFYNIKHKCKLLSNRFLSTSIPLLGSALALLLVVGCLINPVIRSNEEVYAVETASSTNGMEVALTMLDTEAGDVASKTRNIQAGELGTIDFSFNVKAVATGGYGIYVQSASGFSNALRGLAHPDETISTITTTTKGDDNFPLDQWGYNLSNGTISTTNDDGSTNIDLTSTMDFSEVNASNSTSITPAYKTRSTTDANGEDFTITFATKLSNSKPADHYQTKVLLSVAAGPQDVATSWDEIVYMQDMTPEICSQAVADVDGNFNTAASTKQLIDARDGKKYWVAKLKDGSCWMTQNLDLDLREGVALTPADSDVTEDWTPGVGEGTILPTTELSRATWLDDNSIAQSYDAGAYVYTEPTTTTYCDPQTTGVAGCVDKGWKNVAGMIASDDPNFGAGVADNVYNSHYLVGNYYNWKASTAGESDKLGNETIYPAETVQSICPKGWRLPPSQRGEDYEPISINKSFANLLSSYGWKWDKRSTSEFILWYSAGFTSDTGYDVRSAPFYILTGGYVVSGALSTAGRQSRYWSSTALSAGAAYVFNIDSTAVIPITSNNRFHGFSLRCVAR